MFEADRLFKTVSTTHIAYRSHRISDQAFKSSIRQNGKLMGE